jgi:cell division protein FtsI (penicillin-binding protein 3)
VSRRQADQGPKADETPRRSRITEARGYHPRARTVADADSTRRTTERPQLRLVTTTSTKKTTTRTRPASGPASSGLRGAATKERSDEGRRGLKGTRPKRAHTAERAQTDPAPLPTLADPVRRLRIAAALILALFVVIAGRLVELQVTDAPAYAAEGLALRLEEVELPAPRGAILDRNGEVLAKSIEARYVFADPGLVVDPVKTADLLSPRLGIPRSELLPKVRPHKRDDGTAVRFEYLARGVPVGTGDAVSALKLAGIGVRRDESRIVPGHDLAANLIGFTGRDLNGLAGLEASHDEVLRGVDGKRVFEIGQPDGDLSLDHEIPGGYNTETPARPGSTLRLTIDRDLQFEVQRVLGLRMRQVRAITGSAVVLDVRTGEVLAQASYPFYDAANPFASRPADRGDAATGMTLDPGSVHKPIVIAACLEERLLDAGDSVLVAPSIWKGDTKFTDTHPHSRPTRMTLPGILAWSSNVGTITVADRLGPDKLYRYQRAFGLGTATGVGLPGEAAGLVQPPANWSGSAHGSVPIGMGVSVTPVQMAAVYAAIANGGVWVQPHVIKDVVAADGRTTPGRATPTRRVISAENAAAVRTMLEAVVTLPGATGRSAAIDGYRVAGKTGTGKTVRDGRYVAGEVASFIGMAPADAPRYVVAVFAHTPGGNGGAVAAPAFAEMMEFTLRHYRVAPTGTKPPKLRVYP